MVDSYVLETEKELEKIFRQIDNNEYLLSQKILKSFKDNNVNYADFSSSTGYGYGDIGRDKIEKIYSEIFETEDALVRNQFVSGTHALTVALFGLLRPNDKILSITGLPYDTLWPIIGITENESSLKSFNIDFEYIDLINNDFNYDLIKEKLVGVKVVHIQRSIGYSNRNTISIKQIEKVIKFLKEINSNIIVLVDNCYCEFCDIHEPSYYGADVVVGSLIKNLGAGIASNGAYICGKRKYIKLCAERLTSPALGKEVGPSLNQNKSYLQGLYLAPSVVASALKVKLFTASLIKKFNIELINDNLDDIVLGIVFNNENDLVNYVKTIQEYSAIDSNFIPEKSKMPGYDNDIIMASGSFTSGSSIELSCDGPIRKPYIAYQQGSLTYNYGKIAIINAVKKLYEKR